MNADNYDVIQWDLRDMPQLPYPILLLQSIYTKTQLEYSMFKTQLQIIKLTITYIEIYYI